MTYLLIGGAVALGFVVFWFIFKTSTNSVDQMIEDEQIHNYYKPHKKCCGGSCNTVVVASNCPNDVWVAGGSGGYGEVGVPLEEPFTDTWNTAKEELSIDKHGLNAFDAQEEKVQAEVNEKSDFSSLQTEVSYVDTSSNDCCSHSSCCDSNDSDSDSCCDSSNDD